MDIGPSEAETFWTAFLRKLARRGLRRVKLVVSTRMNSPRLSGSRRQYAWLCRLRLNAATSPSRRVKVNVIFPPIDISS